MYIERETVELLGVAILASFVGYLIWTAIFYVANHIYVEWI